MMRILLAIIWNQLKTFYHSYFANIDHICSPEHFGEGPVGSGPSVAEKSNFSVVRDPQVIRNTKNFVAHKPNIRSSSNLAQKSLQAPRTSVQNRRSIAASVVIETHSSKKSEFFSTRATRVLHGLDPEEKQYQDYQENISFLHPTTPNNIQGRFMAKKSGN
jgi:hypothetical protein